MVLMRGNHSQAQFANASRDTNSIRRQVIIRQLCSCSCAARSGNCTAMHAVLPDESQMMMQNASSSSRGMFGRSVFRVSERIDALQNVSSQSS